MEDCNYKCNNKYCFNFRKMVPHLEKPAPYFEGMAVVNGAFKNIKLSDYKGKYVVLFFYPLDL